MPPGIGKRRAECAAHHAKLEANWTKKLAASKDASPIAPAWVSRCINQRRTGHRPEGGSLRWSAR